MATSGMLFVYRFSFNGFGRCLEFCACLVCDVCLCSACCLIQACDQRVARQLSDLFVAVSHGVEPKLFLPNLVRKLAPKLQNVRIAWYMYMYLLLYRSILVCI